ncbi:hypothetical protein ADL02_13770 [Streptomyces sp. NRRL WC-3723]|nr:hypothetical protein ADL02_13770 [Streptomyces sp. NRRL WC-3723]
MSAKHCSSRFAKLVTYLAQRSSITEGIHQLIKRIDRLSKLCLESEAVLTAPVIKLTAPLFMSGLPVQLTLLKQLTASPAGGHTRPYCSPRRTRKAC